MTIFGDIAAFSTLHNLVVKVRLKRGSWRVRLIDGPVTHVGEAITCDAAWLLACEAFLGWRDLPRPAGMRR